MENEHPNNIPPIPSSGVIPSSKKSTLADEIMELIWQNGEAVIQSQNGKSPNKSSSLFMHEDEMAAWLDYPLYDSDFYPNFLCTAPRAEEINTCSTGEIRPIVPGPRSTEAQLPHKFQNFGHFPQLSRAVAQPGATSSSHAARAMTVVDSNDTLLAVVPESRVSGGGGANLLNAGVSAVSLGRWTTTDSTAAAETSGGGEKTSTARELTLTSTSGSRDSVSVSVEPPTPSQLVAITAAEDRKRKGRETDDYEGDSEDTEFEPADQRKKQSTKRSRASEVHNLSERRRRDRINEKLKTLQELIIPRCTKSDKASLLDDAINCIKSYQMTVQMIAMGYNVVPMMYPGVPRYMPMMGMNLGAEMGLNRPMIPPYPSLMPGPAMQNMAQMIPRYPNPAYHLPTPTLPVTEPSTILAANQAGPLLNSLVGQNTNQPRPLNFRDPYPQCLGLQQGQVVLPQNLVQEHRNTNKPSSFIERSPGNHQSG